MFKSRNAIRKVGNLHSGVYPLSEVDKVWLDLGDALSLKNKVLLQEKTKILGLNTGFHSIGVNGTLSGVFIPSTADMKNTADTISYAVSSSPNKELIVVASYPLPVRLITNVNKSLYNIQRHEINRWVDDTNTRYKFYILEGENYLIVDILNLIRRQTDNSLSMQKIVLLLISLRLSAQHNPFGMSRETFDNYLKAALIMPASIFEAQVFMESEYSNNPIADGKVSLKDVLQKGYANIAQSSVKFENYFDSLLPKSKYLSVL